ncbi:hypothetical protein NQ317_000986 [Molorchus minor]|uniref:DUF5641 domain-containing protein n=1 Tax=Molorchus minor TaxID=1323400 RepID=A0ABQ9JN75_9CUCU|nr:hypothetical protein NQ317_000986 [Molorchus minor]
MWDTKDGPIQVLIGADIAGISNPEQKKSQKVAEQEMTKKFSDSIKINAEGRYEVGLTWIEGHPPLPNNFETAKKRLDNLMKKLDIDGYYEMYDEVFQEWLQDGIIEYIPEEDIGNEGYYLPHRHVMKLNSTTKLRPVFDASAKERNQPSLNQCLDKGINLIEHIPSILIRFRTHKIGVISDIRKAFLQISLKKEDTDFLRFLWYDNKGELKFYRHKRVVFGVTCSPFLLGVVINHHLERIRLSCNGKYRDDVLKKLKHGFYIDNCVVSLDDGEELHHFIKEASDIMIDGKFDLRGWEYTIIKDNTLEDKYEEIVQQTTKLSPVLGLIWNRELDTLELNFDWLNNINLESITKRNILSIAHRLFDPIGFSYPVQWLNELQFLRQLRIPRWWEGKTWMEDQKNWPAQKFEIDEEEVLREMRVISSRGLLNMARDFSSIYNYKKNLNQVAWIRRFIFNCLHVKEKKMGSLSVEEINDAEVSLIKLVQEESFSGAGVDSVSSLCPFFDEKGVMRVKTKISERNDTYDFIYPMLLPSKHFVTEKIILFYHIQAFHMGVEGLLCRIREKFWIIKGRLTVKKDHSDNLVPLTPALFLQDVREIGVPDLDEVDAASLKRHAKYLLNIRLSLRNRFRQEYLSQLLLIHSKMPITEFKIGDVVLVESDNRKRLDWPLGVIEEVFPGKDGKSRLVKLRTSRGTLLRPIQRLYPLEISIESDSCNLKDKIKKGDFTSNIQRGVVNKPIIQEDVQTRSGRKVRKPVRLDFPHNLIIETFERPSRSSSKRIVTPENLNVNGRACATNPESSGTFIPSCFEGSSRTEVELVKIPELIIKN